MIGGSNSVLGLGIGNRASTRVVRVYPRIFPRGFPRPVAVHETATVPSGTLSRRDGDKARRQSCPDMGIGVLVRSDTIRPVSHFCTWDKIGSQNFIT